MPTLTDLLWKDFDPATERVSQIPGYLPSRYKVSQAILDLRQMDSTDEEVAAGVPYASRSNRAAELNAEGEIIDTQLDIYQWNPAETMENRRLYGCDSVPDAFNRCAILVPPAADTTDPGTPPAPATARRRPTETPT
jgi:hypothetical protein